MAERNEQAHGAPYRWYIWFCMLLPLVLLAILGQDSNWDLRNYHLYNPHAWLHGRMATDVAPAHMQTWFNPLLDTPMYLMVQAGLSGAVVGAWLTLPIIVALYFLLKLYLRLDAGNASPLGVLSLTALALTGAATMPAIGTTFNDGFVAAGLLGCLFLLVRNDPPGRLDWILVGVIAGAMTGLKLTAGVYCLGLGAAACVAMPWRPWRDCLPGLLALICGGVFGFLLSYGYWGWTLWQLHGNPFFPLFNQYFQSPDALQSSFVDPKYRPGNWSEGLSLIFQLLHSSRRFSEVPLRDPRLVLGLIAGVVLMLRGQKVAQARGGRQMLVAFYLTSLAAWLWLYSIYRYVVTIELLACLFIVLALQRLPGRTRPVAVLVATALIVAVTAQPDWERRRFQTPMVQIPMPRLPPNSLVVESGDEPIGFAALALSDDTPMVSIYGIFMSPERCTALQARAEQAVVSHEGPLWLLRTAWPADDIGQQIAERWYGLMPAGPCRDLPTSLDRLRLCPLSREPRPRHCVLHLDPTGR